MIATLATPTLGGTLADKLRAAAEAGFRGIEVFDTDLDAQTQPAAVRRMIADHGFEAVDLFALRDIEGMPGGLHGGTRDRAERYLDTATAIGAGMVMACSNVQPASLGDAELIAADLHALGDLAAERGLRFAYEALSWGHHVCDYRVAWDLVQRADHPQVGLVLDSFHIQARGHDLATIAAIPAERIFLVQISDAPLLDLDCRSWSRGHRTLPGRGQFDLHAFMAALRATGYDAIVSLECFSDALRSAPPTETAAAGHHALTNLWTT